MNRFDNLPDASGSLLGHHIVRESELDEDEVSLSDLGIDSISGEGSV
jgi:hypothetical protein